MTRITLKTGLVASAAIFLIAAGPKADLNQDGQVTKVEFSEAAQAHFLAADTDGDGFLSDAERTEFRTTKSAERKDKRFSKMDANGDGTISREEMEAVGEKMQAHRAERRAKHDEMKAKMLERFDTNLDGELSDAERTVMKAERDANDGERAGRKGGKRGKRGERPNPDANGDGFVSLAEHMAVSEQLFTRLDANGDGVLTKGEGRKRRGKRGR